MQESWAALCEIARLPTRVEGTPLAAYGRFKVGESAAVDRYASLLVEPLAAVISSMPGTRRWILSAPPVRGLPAAANLLCTRVQPLLARELPGIDLRSVFLDRAPLGARFLDSHYGGRDVSSRREYLQDVSRSWSQPPVLEGAHVLFVNDVHVTGSQEAELRRHHLRSGAETLHWQYVFSVVADTPEAAAQLEAPLNQVALSSDSAFIDLLRRSSFTITTKFLWRLFALDIARFERAVETLGAEQCTEILRLLRAEAVPAQGPLVDRVAVLRAATG